MMRAGDRTGRPVLSMWRQECKEKAAKMGSSDGQG